MYALQLSNELVSADKQYIVELALGIIRKHIDKNVKSPDKEIAMMLIETSVPKLIDTLENITSWFSKLRCCCKC